MRRRRPVRGFTLVEIALALGIVSFAMLSLLGLAGVGLRAMRGSMDDTATSLILHQIKDRLNGLPAADQTLAPMFFDKNDLPVVPANPPDYSPSEIAAMVYRADVTIASPTVVPAHTSNLKAAVVQLSWPVSGTAALAANAGNRAKLSFLVTSLTPWGSDLPGPSGSYKPKIEL